jgi:hypothetical protein
LRVFISGLHIPHSFFSGGSMSIYYLGDEGMMAVDNRFPDILCEGDSWYSYPLLPAGNLINEIDAVFLGGRTIFNTAETGDRIVNILNGASRDRFIGNLCGYPTVKAILFSGGGNDFIGNLLNMLEPDCSGKTTAASCFRMAEMDAQYQRISNAYRELISLRNIYRPGVPIVTHQYDYAIPSDKGVFWFGSWVKPRLEHVKVPAHLHLDISTMLIDRFIATLAALEDSQFIVIPTAGTLLPGDWQDEIHPNRSGIRKIVAKFEPVLRRFVI